MIPSEPIVNLYPHFFSSSHVFGLYDRILVSQDDVNWSVAMGYIMNINEQSIVLALDK